mmetsp:Transcript_40003/g.68243  ORF Transcript_40003/g.68243 Transcript_40003/m.68243 type:complete len:467 (+) Transcript_40003:303-1703(+)
MANSQQLKTLPHSNRRCPTQQKSTLHLRTSQHLALRHEIRGSNRQRVQKVANVIRKEILQRFLNRIGKEFEVQSQIPLRFVRQNNLRLPSLDQGIDVHPVIRLAFGNDRFEARVRVQEVDGRVALRVQHAVVREDVIGGGISAEVEVLDGAVSHGRCRGVGLLLGDVHGLPLLHAILQTGFHAGDGLVEEVHETDGIARPGLEPFAVLSLHGPEANVIQSMTLVRHPANLFGGRKDHGEVIRLREVGDVHYLLRLELIQSVLDGRHVRGIVSVPPIALLDHERYFEFRHKDALGPSLLDAAHAPLDKFINDRRDLIVVKGFPALLHRDIQPLINLLKLLPADIAEDLPYFATLLVPRLELHHVELTDFLKFGTLVEPALGIFVKRREVGDVGHVVVKVGVLLLEVLDEHPELRAPVADVVDAADVVAGVFEDAAHGLADDGGAQVTHVHFLGDVGTGEVDDDDIFG